MKVFMLSGFNVSNVGKTNSEKTPSLGVGVVSFPLNGSINLFHNLDSSADPTKLQYQANFHLFNDEKSPDTGQRAAPFFFSIDLHGQYPGERGWESRFLGATFAGDGERRHELTGVVETTGRFSMSIGVRTDYTQSGTADHLEFKVGYIMKM